MVSPTQGSSSWGRSSLRHKILSNFEFRLRTCIIKEYAKLRFFWHKQNNKWGKTCSRRETIIQTVSIFQIRAAFLNYSVQKSLTQDFFWKSLFSFSGNSQNPKNEEEGGRETKTVGGVVKVEGKVPEGNLATKKKIAMSIIKFQLVKKVQGLLWIEPDTYLLQYSGLLNFNTPEVIFNIVRKVDPDPRVHCLWVWKVSTKTTINHCVLSLFCQFSLLSNEMSTKPFVKGPVFVL